MKGWTIPAGALVIVFVVTRLPALALHAVDSDINVYARYAAEWQEAQKQHQSFYDVHRRHVEQEIDAWPEKAAALQEYKSVEYPPLAVALMTVPAYLLSDPFLVDPPGKQPRYVAGYIGLMALCDAAVLAYVFLLVRRLYPAASPFAQWLRCLVYVICGLPLYGVLYARLDLGVALLTTASLGLLIAGGRPLWPLSFAVLALAIHFKLMPIVLAPLWLLAALPGAALTSRLAYWPALAARAAVLAGFCLALVVPFYLLEGGAVFEFLDYHKDRGIEVESTAASVALLLRYVGVDSELYHSHGSVNVRSAVSPFLATATTAAMALSLLAATAIFAWRSTRTRWREDSTTETISQGAPHAVANFALLLLLIAIVTNKVFSPQYLIWVLPLVALVDLGTVANCIFWAGMFATCFLTMRILPDYFRNEIAGAIQRDGVELYVGPTDFGVCLLVARNGLCLAMLVGLTWRLLRQPFHPRPLLVPRLGASDNTSVV